LALLKITAFSPISQYIEHIFLFRGLQTNSRSLWFLVKRTEKEEIDTFLISLRADAQENRVRREKSG